MATSLEFTVYMVVFLGACYTVLMLLFSRKKFLKGEFKDFINAVVAASMAYLFGSLFTLLTALNVQTIYYSTYLIMAGFAFVLTSIYFVKAALMLDKVSRIFGFAQVEKEFDHLFKEAKTLKARRQKSRKR